MLTIFALPKPFRGDYKRIQENAIKSWLNLGGNVEIILLGDDYGVEKAAKKYNLKFVSKIDRNKYGTPFLKSLINKADKMSTNDILMYVNSDIVLPANFLETINVVSDKFKKFLIIGERIDVDYKGEIKSKNDITKVFKLGKRKGKLHGPTGIDYFVFNRNLWKDIPSLVIGRKSWDNWLVYEGFRISKHLVDITRLFRVVHQNHPTYKSFNSANKRTYETEVSTNSELTKGKEYNRFDANYYAVNILGEIVLLKSFNISRFFFNQKKNINNLINFRLRNLIVNFFESLKNKFY